MKFSTIVYAGVVAVASVHAAAVASEDPYTAKLKRAADAAAEALAIAEPEPEAFRIFCHLPGQGCSKAKRSAEAVADAVAKAYAVAEPEADAFRIFCHLPGQGCSKVKRSADAEAMASPEA
ncbi:hypothetical protein LTR16_003740, partial [Cryomyces antarcticus]